MWELDSSSPAKWSRHIIVAIPGRAFPNNLVLGAFVNQILSLPQVSFGYKGTAPILFVMIHQHSIAEIAMDSLTCSARCEPC